METDQISQCNIFNEQKKDELFRLLHMCIDEICDGSGPTFQQFSNVDWTKEEFNTVHTLISKLFHNPNCLYIDNDKMPLEYFELPENAKQAVLICLRVRKSQLTDSLVLENSSKYVPTLRDFDWRLKYITGSSKMASIREPLLQLDLILKEQDEEKLLELELNIDELNSLISNLETIHS